MKKEILTAIIIIVLLIGGFFFWQVENSKNQNKEIIAPIHGEIELKSENSKVDIKNENNGNTKNNSSINLERPPFLDK